MCRNTEYILTGKRSHRGSSPVGIISTVYQVSRPVGTAALAVARVCIHNYCDLPRKVFALYQSNLSLLMWHGGGWRLEGSYWGL